MKKYLTLKEAAEFASVHPNTIRNWIRSGFLKACRPGRDLRIKRIDLENFFVSASPHAEDYEKKFEKKKADRTATT